MSRHLVLKAEEAVRDIEEITDEIAIDNPNEARDFLLQLKTSFASLATIPESVLFRFPGIERLPSIQAFVMAKPFDNYLILYQLLEDSVKVIRVRYGVHR